VKELSEYSLGDKGSVLVEVEAPEPGSGFAPAGRTKDIMSHAIKSLDDALDDVKEVSSLIVAKLISLANAPQETTVELGFKFGAQGKAILISGNAEGHVKLTMTWKGKLQDA
jgi:hypothetical protein